MLFYGCVLVLQNGSALFQKQVLSTGPLLGHLLLFTVLIPAALIGVSARMGWIKSLRMENPADRHFPHLFTFLMYLLTGIFLDRLIPVPELLPLMITGTAVCIGLVGLITVFWKISSHMAGSGGLTGFFIAFIFKGLYEDFILLFSLSLLLALLVAGSRYYLKAHNLPQLLAGFFLGMLCSSISVCFFAELF